MQKMTCRSEPLPYSRDPSLSTSTRWLTAFVSILLCFSAASASAQKTDILFLIDSTGTMGAEVSSIRASASTIAAIAQAVTGDAAFAVAIYRDFPVNPYGAPGDSPYVLLSQISVSVASFQNALNGITASGGFDPEGSGLFAVHSVATTTPGWRVGAHRVVFWIGDWASHDGDLEPSYASCCTAVGLGDAIAAVTSANLTVWAVDTGAPGLDLTGQATAIAVATGGILSTAPAASVGAVIANNYIPTLGLPDGDGDGIADEFDNCPIVMNPLQEDFDGDGEGDLCDLDDDNDGLTDAFEITTTLTDPFDSDSDDDGASDGAEFNAGTDPNDPASTPPEGPGFPPFFQGLGGLDSPIASLGFGVSGDGSTAIGPSTSSLVGGGTLSYRWTYATGIVSLGSFPGGPFASVASGISSNGSVIVGSSDNEMYRWTLGGGMVGLGDLPGGSSGGGSAGQDVSDDGTVVVGSGHSASGLEAVRWTSAGGLVGLGDLPGGTFFSQAFGVSGDGNVVVGRGTSALGDEAFRWTESGGMIAMDDLNAGGFIFSEARDATTDGAVIVGTASSPLGSQAFRWTVGGGMVGLGDIAGGSFGSTASAVSADGSVIVGAGLSASGQEAFIWDAVNGVRELDQVLTGLGLDLTGWTLAAASDVSDDGLTIMGSGTNPSGQQEAWIAVLGLGPTAVPSIHPLGLVVLMSLLGLIGLRRL